MSRTYVPSIAIDIHDLAVYIARYEGKLDAAIAVLGDAELVAAWVTFKAAVSALNAFTEILRPIGD